ncbi:Asd/ArgC dimerization domain-containing protein [Acidobacteriota bacterium]
MAVKPLNIAIFEATNLIGKELRKFLPDSGIPVNTMKFFGEGKSLGKIAEFEAEPMLVQELDEDLYRFLDVLFLCDVFEGLDSFRSGEKTSDGPIIFDLAGASDPDLKAGRFVVDVKEPDASKGRRHFASPDAASVLLSSALKPLADKLEISSVHAVVFRPVSDFGEKGIDELYKQTLGLLNMETVPVETLSRRIAFDLCPSSGTGGKPGADYLRVEKELRLLLPDGAWNFEMTSFLPPVFYGLSALLTIEGKKFPTAKKVEKLLGAVPNLSVQPTSEPPSPGRIEDNDGIFITVLPTADPRRTIKCWIAGDNLRRGCVLNAIEILERYLARING